ncbi:MAG: hypothetical protein ABSF84_04575 [Acidimicrobiales bacterium]|jgi:hypothetical protein
MVDTAARTVRLGSGEDWGMRSLKAVDDPKRRLDRLVPLLHEMIAWDLVEQTEDGGIGLREDVQERLRLLAADRPLHSAEVYVGRKCERCGHVCVTRMVDGARVCSACSQVTWPGDDQTAVDTTEAPRNQRAGFHRWWRAS